MPARSTCGSAPERSITEDGSFGLYRRRARDRARARALLDLARVDEHLAARCRRGSRDERVAEASDDLERDGAVRDADADRLLPAQHEVRHEPRRWQDERVRPGDLATQHAIGCVVDDRVARDLGEILADERLVQRGISSAGRCARSPACRRDRTPGRSTCRSGRRAGLRTRAPTPPLSTTRGWGCRDRSRRWGDQSWAPSHAAFRAHEAGPGRPTFGVVVGPRTRSKSAPVRIPGRAPRSHHAAALSHELAADFPRSMSSRVCPLCGRSP